MHSHRQGQPDRATQIGWVPILAALIVLIALGCAPMSAKHGYAYAGEAEQRYEYDEDLAYGGIEGGAGAADYAELDSKDVMLVTESPAKAKKSGAKFERERSRDRGPSPASPTPTASTDSSTTTLEPELEPEPPPEPQDPDQDQSANTGRQIIYTAGMGVSVFDVAETMTKLEAIPERYGGWVHQRYDTSVVLRVPAAQLEAVIREVSSWGVLEWKTLEALDVTAQYTDLESRIRVLEQMHLHLSALLEKAENVEQALEIQVELARITAELEQLRAQMRMLASSIEFSTLAVQLQQRGTREPEPGNDPFGWVDELGVEATAYDGGL
jgi:hypothetical protein